MKPLPCSAAVAPAVALTLTLVACGAAPPSAPPAPPAVVTPAAALPGASETATLTSPEAAAAPDPDPRPGSARRFLKLPLAAPPGAPLRVGLDVPASWGIRLRNAGGRALRPCQVSPSSPSELMVQVRPACAAATCAEHEKLEADMIAAQLITASDIESRASESRGGLVHVTRLQGHLGGHSFAAFRYVQLDQPRLLPVACESFLFEDEIDWLSAYEAACASLRIAPDDWQESPDELAPAPDGRPRTPVEEAAIQSAQGYVQALGLRDAKSAGALLLTDTECVAVGGPPDDCGDGAADRRNQLRLGLDRIPLGFPAGVVDVRFPAALGGLAIATVKRRGDPCGPGYEVTMTRAQSRFAVVSPDPMPDARLLAP